jgi:hypothetical protein
MRNKPFFLHVVSLLWAGSLLASPALAQQAPAAPMTAQQRYAEFRLLLETAIETRHLQGDMPLSKFLTILEQHLPPDKKLPLRIDQQAFGKVFDEIAATQIRIQPVPKRLSLGTVFNFIISQLPKGETDYGIWPTHVAITTPARTAYMATYEIKEICKKLQPMRGQVVAQMQKLCGSLDLRNVEPADMPGVLLRLIHTIEPESWSLTAPDHGTIQLVNGSRLVVRARRRIQWEIDSLLACLERLADVAVVMRAELYELDQAFYGKHIGPLLAVPGKTARLLVPVEDGLSHQIEKHKLLLKGEPVKLVEGGQGTLLSLQSAFTYLANLKGHGLSGERTYKTALEGVSMRARVAISSDRRSVRLTLTQNTTHFLGMKQAEDIDFATGKAAAVEAPALKTDILTATATIMDTSACLMPLAYRSREAREKGRIWVLLFRPRIRIEEEERAIRQGEVQFPPGAGRSVPEEQ